MAQTHSVTRRGFLKAAALAGAAGALGTSGAGLLEQADQAYAQSSSETKVYKSVCHGCIASCPCIPHALIGAAIFLTVLFGAFATVLYGLFPADGFAELGTDAPLIVVGGSLFGLAGIVWMTIHCFTGSMSTANGGVMGQTRVLYAMAREGWFPRSFSKLDENGTPTTALLVTAVSMILVSFLPIVTLDAWTLAGFLGVFGYGLCYMFACGLLIYLRVKRPELERPFRCPLVPVIPAIGIVLYSLAIAFSGIQVIVVGVVWCAAGVAYYYLVGRRSRAKYLAEQGSETVVSPRNAAAQPAAIVSE